MMLNELVNKIYEKEDDKARVREIISETLAALYDEGYVVIPKKPTEFMLEAGAYQVEKWMDILTDDGQLATARSIYETMLSARPRLFNKKV